MPTQNFTIRNDSLGQSEPNTDRFLFIGAASAGTNDVIVSASNPSAVVTAFGQGPLAEAMAYHLATAGGPVYGMKVAASTAGTASAVTKSAVDSSTGTVTVANAPYDSYQVIVEIMTSGTLGAGEFRYSLDGGRDYSPKLLIPSGATYDIPNTNIELTFVPGGGPVYFEDGDTHSFTCTAPHYQAGDLTSAVTALLAAAETPLVDAIVFTGVPADVSAAATLFAAINTHLLTLEAAFKFVGGIMDVSSIDAAADVKAGVAGVESDRLCGVYGRGRFTSAKAFTGWAQPLYDGCAVVSAQAARVGLSGDLKRVASGALPGFSELEHDEATAATTLDDARLTTFRTWDGRTGVYVYQGRIKSAPTSDYRLWQHRRVMDRACRVTYVQQQSFIGRTPRANADASIVAGEPGAPGTIYDPDARNLFEQPVRKALRAELKAPFNAEGLPGHVSEFAYSVDRTTDILTTKAIDSELLLVPLLTVDDVNTTLRYAASVPLVA